MPAEAGVYLSLGSFEDFSLNNRHADLPVQLRSYLTAAYQRAKVMLLEREFANTLLKEVQLELAGMTDWPTAKRYSVLAMTCLREPTLSG
jgi:hypothetical protein